MKRITKAELRKEIDKVLYIAPDLSPSEVWLALQKKYPYQDVEDIMEEIEDEYLDTLRNVEPEIKIVDNGEEVDIKEMVKRHDKKPKSKQK